jgi:hypothetical protein
LFQSTHYQRLFAQHQLDGFEPLWYKQIDWVEAPNYRRGGWSGVGQLVLPSIDGELNVFVKKQQSYGRRTLTHPMKGEPTFRREWGRLRFLEAHHIKAPKVVFYAEQKIDNNVCAILITKALLDFEPLDVVTERWFTSQQKTRQQKRVLLKTVALALRAFHETGLMHRALYPKHLFVNNAQTQANVAFIDLEKSRYSWLFLYRAYFDLASLHRHALYWTASDRLYFFLEYFQVPTLNKRLKFIIRRIIKRSVRR